MNIRLKTTCIILVIFSFLISIFLFNITEAAVTAPTINFTYSQSQSTFGSAYNDSIYNLTVTNTVGSPTYFRAGGDYNDAWTRDGSLNPWNAGSLIDPVTAKNTLNSLIVTDATYGQIIDQGNSQWWDMVIWSSAAWHHFLVTGDTSFLSLCYTVTVNSLNKMRNEHYNSTYGLFKGPSFFNDGIAGYPLPYNTNSGPSFVLDQPGTSDLMCLSTNCLYYSAYKSAALMGTQLGKPQATIDDFNNKANDLKTQINNRFWISGSNRYGYFIHGTGSLAGTLENYQEGSGLAFALLFGVADDTKAQAILNNIHFEPRGLPSIWPHFSMYSDSQPGRHNCIIWPQVNGLFAKAAAYRRNYTAFAGEFERVTSLFNGTPGNIREIYNAISGAPDGGWQGGSHWPSCQNQTWSATGYLSMVYDGIFGMNFETGGIRFTPYLKSQWGPVSLSNLKYRNMTLNINLSGNGNIISSFKLDNVTQGSPFVSASLTGTHTVTIVLGDGTNTPPAALFDPTRYYKIVTNVDLNYCIESAVNPPVNDTTVRMWQYSGSDNQLWKIIDAGGGYYKIVNKANENYCIDCAVVPPVNDTKVHMWQYLGAVNQLWSFVNTGGGVYKIGVKANENYCIDCAVIPVSNGTVVHMWQYLGGSNQKWQIVPVNTATPTPTPAQSPTPTPSSTAMPTSTPATGVIFYKDANYGGTASQVFAKGTYTMAQLNAKGCPNDWMSSLKVPAGWTVIVYQNDNFTGTSWTFTADTSYVGSACNDQMTSCRIQ